MDTITATKVVAGEEKQAVITTDLGENFADAVAKFGEEVVYSGFKRSATISVQNLMRSYIEKGKTQEEITSLLAAWKPGVAMQRVIDPFGAILNAFEKKSSEEKQAFIEKLMAKLGGTSPE